MNPFRRFFDFVTNPSNSRTVGILALLIIGLTIPLTVNIAQRQQELRQRAYEAPSCTLGEGLTCDTGEKRDDCSGGLSRSCSCGEGFTGTEVFEKQGDGQCYSNGKCYATCTGRVKPPTTPSTTSPATETGTDGKFCGVQGGKCLSGTCVIGDSLDADFNAQQTCKTTTPTTTACERNNPGAQCIDQATYNDYQRQGKTGTIISASCWTGDQVCFMPSTGTTPSNSCDPNNQNDGWTYQCGAAAGCPADQHKSICTRNPSQDTRCFSDSLFVGANPCATGNAPVTPPSNVPTPSTGGAPAPGFPISCTTGDPVCGDKDKVKAVKLTNGNYLCPAPYLNQGPTCPVSAATPTAGSCPGSGYPVTQDGSQWGGSCPTQGKKEYATVPGSNSCYYVSCERLNSVPANPLCWFNSGVSNPPSMACPVTGTQLSFVVGLDGIGTFGDAKGGINRFSNTSNKNPVRSSGRNFTVQLFNPSSDALITESRGTLTYNGAGSGTFSSTVNFPSVTTGTYKMRVKPDGYLRRNVTGAIQDNSGLANPINITTGINQTLGLPSIIFVTGDIDNNNQLNIEDYNLLLSCMFKTASGRCQNMDLDDNGTVDQFDYNLFVREISVKQQGD